ncbi:hydantoinase [Arthrobacter sp. MYb23]|uniref:hydantoinase B/oxoprolinase family protein n=1 Tax=unclassified Arthrobacter TaxID=235627 RepID=UPI000CFB4DB5|nr:MULTISPECIES: hydantoinase B/oxoprolinase family protein [unclassified Arthrobacter]PRB43027.1 hydantoinase [Arthrobacter sp. MYb51]PRB97980.1 hydantoinase [Arthrobacter sp. MYb23]
MTITETPADEVRNDFDPVLLAVLANRLDGIVREMTNTLLRTGRSAILNTARDFSCSIVTADNELLSAAEGLPIHVIGSQLLTRSMERHHPVINEGDAFLHNDPYDGNTHHADHSILVPVFFDGEHLFTAVAKAHQADCGNSRPTTYAGYAKDIYDEGAINYPCVKIQSNYDDVQDIIRMSKRRIRVPEQWYGDYLASLGAARIGERRLKEVVAKYGVDTIKTFITEWFNYSERLMIEQIRQWPAATLTATTNHDPIPQLDQEIPLNVTVTIDPKEARVLVDLRDNIDCVPAGYNMSEATALASGMTGIFNQLTESIPYNEGSFRRVTVALRQNSIAGIPAHPSSASVATTNVADRVINMTQAAFAGLGEGYGIAEGAIGQGPGMGVISGHDNRRGNSEYINQLYLASSGGPASPTTDGWGFFGIPVTAGIMYRDSVEIDERKYPVLIDECRMLPDSEGAGKFRGAPAGRVTYGPTDTPMNVIYVADGSVYPPQGVRGGLPGHAQTVEKLGIDGSVESLQSAGNVILQPGERIVNITNGGGGYGDPKSRDPEKVRLDVEDGLVSLERAKFVYGLDIEINSSGRAALKSD